MAPTLKTCNGKVKDNVQRGMAFRTHIWIFEQPDSDNNGPSAFLSPKFMSMSSETGNLFKYKRQDKMANYSTNGKVK